MSKKAHSLPKLVLIEWLDHGSWGDGGWTNLKEVQEESSFVTLPCLACGFVIKETDTTITVVNQINTKNLDDEDAECSGDITILKCAIQSIKTLK